MCETCRSKSASNAYNTETLRAMNTLKCLMQAHCFRVSLYYVVLHVLTPCPPGACMDAELVKTEQKFLRDMTILKEVFKDGLANCGILTSAQLLSLFSNIDEVRHKAMPWVIDTGCPSLSL